MCVPKPHAVLCCGVAGRWGQDLPSVDRGHTRDPRDRGMSPRAQDVTLAFQRLSPAPGSAWVHSGPVAAAGPGHRPSWGRESSAAQRAPRFPATHSCWLGLCPAIRGVQGWEPPAVTEERPARASDTCGLLPWALQAAGTPLPLLCPALPAAPARTLCCGQAPSRSLVLSTGGRPLTSRVQFPLPEGHELQPRLALGSRQELAPPTHGPAHLPQRC